MRTAAQLIKSALADEDFISFEHDDTRDVGRVMAFTAKLPGDKYRGLPERWSFGIVLEPDKPTRAEDVPSILADVRAFVREALTHTQTPLLILSDDPQIRLSDNLRLENKIVFFVDHDKLPGVKNFPTQVKAAPFLRAVKEKISRKDISSLFFEPYRPGDPAVGWRFFGRRKELERLVDTSQSFVIVGARRIGKTSLLKEVQRRLESAGSKVYYVSAQELNTAQEVINALARTLSARDTYTAIRRQQALNDSMLRSLLQVICRESERVTVIIDELGNVINKSRQDDWRVMGVFRDFSQSGRLQLLVSGFQEFFVRQLADFGGPFVNLADIMRLGPFSDTEVDEFLIQPLTLWSNVNDPAAIRDQIVTAVGTHPFLLQHLGRAVFHRVFASRNPDLLSILTHLLDDELNATFDSALDEIFFNTTSPAERYLFVRCCIDGELEKRDIGSLEITDGWVQEKLREVGCESSFDGRRLLLESMELKGLTTPMMHNRARQRIVSPVVWQMLKNQWGREEIVTTFADDVKNDCQRLNIQARRSE